MTTTERSAWLKQRRKGIGGSDAASVMGLTKYSETVIQPDGTEKEVFPYAYIPTEYQTWLDKTGLQPREVPDTLQMAAGRSMEPLILARYTELTGEPLLPHAPIMQHPHYPYIQASLDGWTETAVIEAKFGRWTPKWGPDGSDVVPLNYWMQCQHYMLVTGLPLARLCAMLYGENSLEYRIYQIPADYEWHDAMLQRYEEFWRRVEAQIAPDPYTLDDFKTRFPHPIPLSKKEVTPEILDAIEELQRVKSQITCLEADEDSLKLKIIEFYEDFESLTFNGKVISTYKENRAGRRTLTIK